MSLIIDLGAMADAFGLLEIQDVTGDFTITGDLTVNGNINSTGDITHVDNILILNDGESESGVTAPGGLSGIEIDRGTATNYQFVFDESDDLFKVGEVGSLQALMTKSGTINEGKIAFGTNADSLTEDSLFHFDPSTDRLGIGNAAPDTRLHISDSGNVLTELKVSNSSSTTGVHLGVAVGGNGLLSSQNAMTITCNGNTIMSMATDGKVGIGGATNGSYANYMNGTVGMSSTLNVAGIATIGTFVSTGTTACIATRTGTEDANSILRLDNASGQVFRFSKNGMMIAGGSASPTYTVTAVNGSNTLGMDAANRRFISSGGDMVIRANGSGENIRLETNTGERLTILNDGKVGIGDTTPTAGLDVGSGAIRVTGASAPSDGAGLEMIYESSVSKMYSYDRGASQYRQLDVNASIVDIKPGGTSGAQFTATDIILGSIANMRRGNNTGTTVISGSSVSTQGSARILIDGSSNNNDVVIEGTEIFLKDETGSEKLSIIANGNVGINQATASFTLDVNGIMNCTQVYEAGVPFVANTLWDENVGSDGLTAAATWDDWVGIGVTDPDCELQIIGDFKLGETIQVNAILDEDDMASDSATALATQQSIKAYVDANAGSGDGGFEDFVMGGLGLAEDMMDTHFKYETGSGVEELVTICSLGAGVVFCGMGFNAGDADIIKSTDYGRTFKTVYSGSGTDQYIRAIASCGGGNMVASVEASSGAGKMMYSDDWGETWNNATTSIDSGADAVRTIAYFGDEIVIAGSGSGNSDADIWRSTDNGDNWTKVKDLSAGYRSTNEAKYVGNGVGVCMVQDNANDWHLYRTTDKGLNWTEEVSFDGTYTFRGLAVVSTSTIFILFSAGVGTFHLMKSTDAGQSFTEVTMNGFTGEDYASSVTYCGGKTLVLTSLISSGFNNKIWISHDLGENWNAVYSDTSFEQVAQYSITYLGNGKLGFGGQNNSGSGDFYTIDIPDTYRKLNPHGFKEVVKEITDTSYTVTEDDNGLILFCTNASATTITLPDNLETFNDEFRCTIEADGAAGVTVARGGTATINGGSTSLSVSQYDDVRVRKYSGVAYRVSGTYT